MTDKIYELCKTGAIDSVKKLLIDATDVYTYWHCYGHVEVVKALEDVINEKQ